MKIVFTTEDEAELLIDEKTDGILDIGVGSSEDINWFTVYDIQELKDIRDKLDDMIDRAVARLRKKEE